MLVCPSWQQKEAKSRCEERGSRVSIIATIREDLKNARLHDPAARGDLENAIVYSGLNAIWAHRVSHQMWKRGWKGPARILEQFTRFMTVMEIHLRKVLRTALRDAGHIVAERQNRRHAEESCEAGNNTADEPKGPAGGAVYDLLDDKAAVTVLFLLDESRHGRAGRANLKPLL